MDLSKKSNDELYELNIYWHCFSVMLHKLRGEVISEDTTVKVSMELKEALLNLRKEFKNRGIGGVEV